MELKSVPDLTNVYVEVSKSNLPGQDGSLADDFRVDYFYMTESDAFPGTYRGQAAYTTPQATYLWTQQPGTYYWQIQAHCNTYATACGGTGYPDYKSRDYLSEVRTLTVTAPSASPPTGGTRTAPRARGITSADVRAYTRFMIRRKTNGRVRRLSKSCSGRGTRTVICDLYWEIGRYTYTGRAKFHHFIDGGRLYWDFTFTGRKRKTGCGCRAKRLRW